MIIIAFLDGLINLTNTIAAVSSAEKLYQTNTTSKMYKSTFLLTELFSIIGVALGLIPYGPYTSSIGFLESTKIY
ncbi:hypothetical protein FQP34_00935 [Peribacillus simplex]|uniref:Uncharacterized protein n=1 Tax=Peribacillus simplex TaxID=1478 RepID=A0A8B5Y583_9BACI|nr:hypothetical protein FQP34_00935 [Peribacillus simplex]